MALLIAAAAWRRHRVAKDARRTMLDGELVGLTECTGPGARCVGDPRIIIPSWFESLDVYLRTLLLRHEREHVRSGDPHLLLFGLVAVAAMPWNPALRHIARRLLSALELDCDARVLSADENVRAYGELLLTVAANRRVPRLAPYLAFAVPRTTLEWRIRTMTSPRGTLVAWRQCALGFPLLVAAVAARETRRPEPLAPVASDAVSEDRAAAGRPAVAPHDDSDRHALELELHETVPARTLEGSASDPLLLIHDAIGTLVHADRVPFGRTGVALGADTFPYLEAATASDDVSKALGQLPPQARGGITGCIVGPCGAARACASTATPGARGNHPSPPVPDRDELGGWCSRRDREWTA